MRRVPICGLLAFLSFACFGADKNAGKKKDPSEIGHRKVAGGPNFYSLEKEMALGRLLAVEVTRQARILDDPIVSEYVNRIGQNLVRNSDVTFPVTIKIIDSEDLNAFALPGGFVFVNTGLIRLSETEAELASAMAHEIAHVAARHATRQATRDQLASIAAIPIMIGMGGWGGLAARQAMGIGVPLGFLKFSRVYETEADMLGLQYLYAAGYDPTASIDILERIESAERKRPGAISKLFDTHPMTADRIQKTQKNIDQLLPGKPEYVVTTSEYEDVRARLLKLQAKRVEAAPPSLLKKRRDD
ncbi:MAG: M48 family metallopeptidase [Acidobacteriota bacterium]|nr:M48 family metallopeptidase [Acidobacteriota bacterium]